MAGRPAVGLDLGTSAVRAAEVVQSRAGAALRTYGQVALPVGAVRGGEVVDPAAVAEALKRLWATVKPSTKRVVVGVANQKVVVRQVDLPWLPLPELRRSLSFQVQDFIPMPVEQALLDVHPLEEFVDDAGVRTIRVLLVAAAREMVDNTLEAVQAAGLQPVMVDLTGFAVLRAVAHSGAAVDSGRSEALVDVGASVTNIVVHQGGVPRFVRILLMGGDDITDAVAERLGVPPEQAEAVKQQTGLRSEAHGADPVAGRVLEAAASAFVDEVRGSLDYFMAQSGGSRIERLLVSGGGSRLTGLEERLAAVTRLPVEPARSLSRLQTGATRLSDDALAEAEPSASVPVGLALGTAA